MDDYEGFIRRSNKGDSYNFNLESHIKKFDIYVFFQCNLRDKYGFLVITPEKYLIGYNARYGEGTHIGAFARVYRDIHGGGKISGDKEAVYLGHKCIDEYFTACLVNEYRGNEILKEHNNRVYMCFEFADREIDDNSLKVFKKFYDDYNHEVSFLSIHNGFRVYFNHRENDVTLFDISNSLDNVYNYLMEKRDVKVRKKER